MIKSSRNSIANATNPFQTGAKKVLCVCSAGLLRSPTLANVLHEEYGYNTRACGAVEAFALIPLSEALVYWADQIVFVEHSVYELLSPKDKEAVNKKDVKILDLPDCYEWNSEDLLAEIHEQYGYDL